MPKNFATLVEPNSEAISNAVLKAIKKCEIGRLMNPDLRHAKICQMYHWSDVTIRTERVYFRAISTPFIPIYVRLRKLVF